MTATADVLHGIVRIAIFKVATADQPIPEFPLTVSCYYCGMVVMRRSDGDTFHCRQHNARLNLAVKAAKARGQFNLYHT